jgi:hypothetical protein
MKLVFENTSLKQPIVSIVLLDWSVRESYHVLDYLHRQTVPKERYEIIWIEYYDRRAKEIERRLSKGIGTNVSPAIDTWIVMDMPHSIYYHKHLMYNAGIVFGKGKIITFMDSDAVAGPAFIESVIRSFNENSDIVVHMDQVRNVNKKFYPFNYPSIEEIKGEGCANLVKGKPRGLTDGSDPLHLPNYGACMSATRNDLISIGGADEHRDYLGHMCGPYEMTFRLVNAGKRELWHQDEWLYHTWHPGQAGDRNYGGPHDGRHMSQAALSARRTRRILPRIENPAVRELRLKNDVSRELLLPLVISDKNMKEWTIDEETVNTVGHSMGFSFLGSKQEGKSRSVRSFVAPLDSPLAIATLYIVAAEIILKQIIAGIVLAVERAFKKVRSGDSPAGSAHAFQKDGTAKLLYRVFTMFRNPVGSCEYIIDRCWHCLNDLKTEGINEIALLCSGDVAKVLCIVSKDMHMGITALYEGRGKKKKLMGHKVLPVDTIKYCKGPVVIASFHNVVKKAELLKEEGVPREIIVDLW